MSYCLNPKCTKSQNAEQSKFCINCGSSLLLRDRYRAIELIGQGGFGKTFLAVDEDKPSQPPCVIKQFFPTVKGTASIAKAGELFQQEAATLERLGVHPQIPDLFAYFVTADGQQYLVQEFISGQNLGDELHEQGAFSQAKILEILPELLQILGYVHDNQVIHRDIKPENIIRRASDRKLFLVDFGAAKSVSATTVVNAGTSIGTFEYTAPEQLRGFASFGSDLYSLGVTCLNLLTGIAPDQLSDMNEMVWTWEKQLGDRSIGHHFTNILNKLVAYTLAERYQSVAEVLSDLAADQLAPSIISAAMSQTSPPSPTITPSMAPAIVRQPVVPAVQRQSYQYWRLENILDWHNRPINALTFFPGGQSLASADELGNIAVWNLKFQKPAACVCSNREIWAIAIHPGGQILISGEDKKVQVRRLPHIGSVVRTLRVDLSTDDTHGGKVYALAFNGTGKLLASASADQKIRLWNSDNWSLLYTFDGHQQSVTSLGFLPNSNILVSAGADRSIRFWDTSQKKSIKVINDVHSGTIHQLAISDRYIASASSDHTIKLQDLQTSQSQFLTGHRDTVLSVAISPNNQWLASGSIDRTIRLWHLPSGQLAETLTDFSSAVKALAFSPDSAKLVGGSWDKTIKIYGEIRSGAAY
jgi:serine/threonine protein kinase